MASAEDKNETGSEGLTDSQEIKYKSKRYTVSYINTTQFYQLPKFLFFGKLKTELSNNAKVLYALLRDRHELSIANDWVNEEGQVYIVFTRDEMRELLGGVSKTTVKKAVEELKAFDLMDEIQQGMNKPNIIYVKYIEQEYVNDLLTQEKVNKEELYEKHLQDEVKQRTYRENYKRNRIEARLAKNKQPLQEENNTEIDDKSGSPENGLPGSRENGLPGSREFGLLEVQKMDRNKTDIYNKTYSSNDTDFNNNENTGTDELLDVPSINPSSETQQVSKTKKGNKSRNKKSVNDGYDMIDDIKHYEKIIKENIEYDAYVISNPTEKGVLDGVVSVMSQIMISNDDTTYGVRGTQVPASLVKKRVMMVNYDIIDYILWSLRENAADIKDIFKYLVSTIYNAPVTADTWMQQRVQYDMKNKF